MSTKTTIKTSITAAGTAVLTETLSPTPLHERANDRDGVRGGRSPDQVLALGTSVLAPGLATPLGR